MIPKYKKRLNYKTLDIVKFYNFGIAGLFTYI